MISSIIYRKRYVYVKKPLTSQVYISGCPRMMKEEMRVSVLVHNEIFSQTIVTSTIFQSTKFTLMTAIQDSTSNVPGLKNFCLM